MIELRDEIAEVLEAVARDGLPGPRDLDVALDAIEAAIAATRQPNPDWNAIGTAPVNKTMFLAATKDGRMMIWRGDLLAHALKEGTPDHLRDTRQTFRPHGRTNGFWSGARISHSLRACASSPLTVAIRFTAAASGSRASTCPSIAA